jgi:hypothetical protein
MITGTSIIIDGGWTAKWELFSFFCYLFLNFKI